MAERGKDKDVGRAQVVKISCRSTSRSPRENVSQRNFIITEREGARQEEGEEVPFLARLCLRRRQVSDPEPDPKLPRTWLSSPILYPKFSRPPGLGLPFTVYVFLVS